MASPINNNNNELSVPPLDLTPEEQLKIDELRVLLQPILTNKDSVGFKQAVAHSDDSTLLRFLQARSFVVDDAATMFTTSMEWRETVSGWNGTQGVQAIYEACENKDNERVKKALSVFWGLCVTTERALLGGGPILYEKLGSADMAGIAAHPTMMEDMERCYVYYIEKAFRCVRKQGGRCKAQVLIDLHGLSSNVMRYVTIMSRIAKIGAANYPEVTQQVAMVRGPWIVRTIWAVISPILPPHTKEKVAILGKDFTAPLLERVPEKCIPREWMGEEGKEDEPFLLEFLNNRSLKV